MSTFSDIMLGIRLALAYGPTIRAGVKVANESPEIVAAILAVEAALKQFHAETSKNSRTSPARPMPGILPADAADDLTNPNAVTIGPRPEGPSNPQI